MFLFGSRLETTFSRSAVQIDRQTLRYKLPKDIILCMITLTQALFKRYLVSHYFWFQILICCFFSMVCLIKTRYQVYQAGIVLNSLRLTNLCWFSSDFMPWY